MTLFFLLFLFSCALNQATTDKSNADSNRSLTPQPVLLDNEEGFENIKMSFTESSTSDNSITYKVNSTYENKNIGFDLTVPTKGSGKLSIKNNGTNSDNFIYALQKIYKQKNDSASKFVGLITADCISMGDYIDSLNKQSKGNYTTTAQNKLFFQGTKEDDYAELYLNINTSEHWIELKEKDIEYRPVILKLLTRH